MDKFKVILIGAGLRGKAYTDIMADMEGCFEIIGVAEPIPERREYIREKHNVPAENCVDSWEKLLDRPKFADIAVICTMDRMHFEPTMAAIAKKYDILVEKPVAPTPEECGKIANYAKEQNVKVMVCHVLRYTTYYKALRNLIQSGKLGKVMTIEHTEGVGHIHQSHSFVRGNWGNSERSSTILLQKTCHDMDILQWLIDKKPLEIQSFGKLSYFKPENAPAGAPDYCIQGCPAAETCHYNAVKLYLDDKENLWFREASTQKCVPSDEEVKEAISTKQYGKCVFKCDNDVMDHQIVNILFEDDVTASFHVSAFNEGGRRSVIMGTEGELRTEMNSNIAQFFNFATRQTEEINLASVVSNGQLTDGHGGGDTGVVEALYDYVTDKLAKNEVSEIDISCKNHMIVFAAEESRLEHTVVDVQKFTDRFCD